jgi:hypothetical protein
MLLHIQLIQVEAICMKFVGTKSKTLCFAAGTSQLLPGQMTIN